MIAIVNVGGPDDGVCEYELRINRNVITKFKHNRTENLSTCLRKAAKAYDDHMQDEILKYYIALQEKK